MQMYTVILSPSQLSFYSSPPPLPSAPFIFIPSLNLLLVVRLVAFNSLF